MDFGFISTPDYKQAKAQIAEEKKRVEEVQKQSEKALQEFTRKAQVAGEIAEKEAAEKLVKLQEWVDEYNRRNDETYSFKGRIRTFWRIITLKEKLW